MRRSGGSTGQSRWSWRNIRSWNHSGDKQNEGTKCRVLLTEIISFSASVVPGGGSGEGIRKMNKEHEWYEVWIDVFYKGEKVGCGWKGRQQDTKFHYKSFDSNNEAC